MILYYKNMFLSVVKSSLCNFGLFVVHEAELFEELVSMV
jgi:hypothetical protein